MLSEKVVNFCKTQGWWFDDASPEYEVELQKLGVDLSSDFAEFYLHTEDGPTFIQKGKEIYQVCWFSKNSNYDLALKRAHETLKLPKEYLPLDSFEGEGGFFYNKVSGEVVELSLGQDLTDFKQGKLKPQWSSFNKFLEMYFGLI
ncbi:SMI1/KNR4 family protein [Pseudomonas syringae]